MANLDTVTIAKRSIRGIGALTFAQIVNTALVFLLTIFIDPRTFGVFIVVAAVLSFLSYFSDIGLAAALVQKKKAVTKSDLVTTFTIQQLLVIFILVVSFFLTGFVAKFYELDTLGKQLYWALLFSFFLASLKTIPSVILERNLDFQKLVIPQIAEALTFNTIAVLLSLRGFGIASFTFATIARSLVGVFLIYLISPWRISLGISRASAKKLLSFGIPFQLNSILALIKDDLFIIVLSKVLSLTQVGYIGFAQKWSFLPLRLLMDKLIRVTFPAFSRMQDNKKVLGIAIEKTIFTVSLFTFPALFGLAVLAPYAITIIPQYNKWEPAIPLIIFFATGALLSSISTPLINTLNALGKIRVTLRLMVFWTVATWALSFTLIAFYGFIGVAVASAVISTSVILVIYLARRYVKFAIFRPIIKPFLSAAVMGGALYLVTPLFIANVPTLILGILGGAIIYFATIFLLAKKEVLSDLKVISNHLGR